jgi:hypothetical protein
MPQKLGVDRMEVEDVNVSIRKEEEEDAHMDEDDDENEERKKRYLPKTSRGITRVTSP